MNKEQQTQESVLGLMLLYPQSAPEIAEKCKPQWFQGYYQEAYKILHEGGDVLSIATNIESLSTTQVAGWMELEFSRAAADRHLQQLERQYQRRELQALARQILGEEDPGSAFHLIEKFQNDLVFNTGDEPLKAAHGITSVADMIKVRSETQGLLGMSYGLRDLDEKTQGLQKKELVVVGGAPGMGKTSLGQGIAEHAAGADHNVLFFSLEMSTEQLLMRSLAAETRIPLQQIRAANFADGKWSSIYQGAQKIGDLNLWIDDTAGQDLSSLTRKIKKMNRKEGLDLVIIDYLQIMAYNKKFAPDELDEITAGLKNLAKAEDICIVLLSQLSRDGYKPPKDGAQRMPTMSDLRGSGQIEANSDVILFPWRPAANCELCAKGTVTSTHDPEIHRHEAAIKIGKQRQGENNIIVDLLWIPEQTRFKDLAR